MTARNSTKSATSSKPYKDFPLFLHASGQWAKKVRGKMLYFGPDSDQAMERWLREKDDLLAGRTPRAYDPDALTLKALRNLFLESREAKIPTGELTQRSWDDYAKATREVIKVLGSNTPINQLRPDDFAKLRSKLGKSVSLKTLDGRIVRAKAMFNYASKNGFIELNLNRLWGTEFNKPSKSAISKQQGDHEQLFSREEILKLLEHAGHQMKAMILLGINGGYGNTDAALIEQADIVDGWLTRKRQKTGKRRRTPLWKETLEAIKNAIAKRPEPSNEADATKVFITKYGNAWTPSEKDNPVSKEFAKVAKAAGIIGKGKSFYTLRHTFQTIGDETKDFVAVSALMGHVDSTISGHYREKISDERLMAVTEHVRAWLYPPKKAAKRTAKKGGAK